MGCKLRKDDWEMVGLAREAFLSGLSLMYGPFIEIK